MASKRRSERSPLDRHPDAAVAVTSLSVAVSPEDGGDETYIYGTGFDTGGVPVVTIDGVAASVLSYTANSIRVSVPAGTAGTVDVAVTVSDDSFGQGESNLATAAGAFEYFANLSIASLTPDNGGTIGGTSVTIAGTGFGIGLTSITFDGVAATSVVVNSDIELTCVAPAGSVGTADVVITPSVGDAVTEAAGYTYRAPTFASIAPDTGLEAGGTAITLTGTNFDLIENDINEVQFGGDAATSVVYVNATTITCDSPAGTGVVDVTIDTADVYADLVLTAAYTYT